MASLKIGKIEFNLDSVPTSKKIFVQKFKHIPNVDQYWQKVKEAKKNQ